MGRILAVIALSLCIGVTAEAEHGTRTGQKTGHELSGTSSSTWAQWERVRSQYRVSSKTSRKALAAQIVAIHPLDKLPKLEGPTGEWIEPAADLSAAEHARLVLRLNLKRLKRDLIQQLETMLAINPPDPKPEVDVAAAIEKLADVYLRAVDEFLATHPGAKPQLGSRNLVADAVGLQDEFNAPWCADWAAAMLQSTFQKIPGNDPIHQVFRFEWGQAHAKFASIFPIQHNFMIVRPVGRPARFPLNPKDKSALMFDPWRTLNPRAYFANPKGRWYENPTNTGLE